MNRESSFDWVGVPICQAYHCEIKCKRLKRSLVIARRSFNREAPLFVGCFWRRGGIGLSAPSHGHGLKVENEASRETHKTTWQTKRRVINFRRRLVTFVIRESFNTLRVRFVSLITPRQSSTAVEYIDSQISLLETNHGKMS